MGPGSLSRAWRVCETQQLCTSGLSVPKAGAGYGAPDVQGALLDFVQRAEGCRVTLLKVPGPQPSRLMVPCHLYIRCVCGRLCRDAHARNLVKIN